MSREFDYPWERLPSPAIEYTKDRIRELLDYVSLPSSFFLGKVCLDAGCGNGRWTYALQQLGAKVRSFDVSPEAVEKCKDVNPEAYVFDLLNLAPIQRMISFFLGVCFIISLIQDRDSIGLHPKQSLAAYYAS
jgi:SAM-dependent methyltransferase